MALRGPSLVASGGGRSASHCAGFSLPRLLLLQSAGLRARGFSSGGMQARWLRCAGLVASPGCAFFLGQGSNPSHLHWQMGS